MRLQSMRIREINIAWFWLAVILTVCSMTVRALVERMTQAVADFVGDTEQSDDLTMLAMQWKK